MEVRYPAYYESFRCLAGLCPDSCCKEWAVAVDEASAARYRALSSPLGILLQSVMREEDGDTILALTADGRCPMWRRDGLCRIQAELGEEGLCHTCRQFPRLRHDYGNFVELGLELSCPEAARLILSGKDRHPMVCNQPGGDLPEYDLQVMSVLLHTRQEALDVLNCQDRTPGEALSILLLWGYRVQAEIDGSTPAPWVPDAALQEARQLAAKGNAATLLALYQNLEILTKDWQQLLENPVGGFWTEAHRAMANYLVERYWLQAVSDLDLVGRVKFIISSCLTVKLLGGNVLVTAQKFSKEIENNSDNVAALLDAAYTEPALADTRLLGLLLE